MSKSKLSVYDCIQCPFQVDGYCNIGTGIDLDIAIYGLPPNGEVGDCENGGIPEQCPLRKQKTIVQLGKGAVINIGQFSKALT